MARGNPGKKTDTTVILCFMFHLEMEMEHPDSNGRGPLTGALRTPPGPRAPGPRARAQENVPANSSAEQELVASPYGQLLTDAQSDLGGGRRRRCGGEG